MPRSIPVLNFTNAKEERKAAGRSFSERDPGGSVTCLILMDLELLHAMKAVY